jgi:serine/threonine protein kinase
MLARRPHGVTIRGVIPTRGATDALRGGSDERRKPVNQTVVYTEGYAPPEQLVGKAEPRSDLFSLAATLYHLATGKRPDGCHTADEIEALLRDPSGPIPAEHRWFFELLKVNLSEDPNDRYYSARQFKADLERCRITREVRCPGCQAVNSVRVPYCVNCAAPLTDPTLPCRYCGNPNRMGSRFCIHCGKQTR